MDEISNKLLDVKLMSFKIFKVVYEVCNFTHAATRLNLDTNAVTRRIDKLENIYGVLFKRSKNSIQRTPLADRLYPASIALLECLKDTQSTTKYKSTEEHTYTLATNDLFSISFEDRVLEHYKCATSHKLKCVSIPSASDANLYSGVTDMLEDNKFDMVIHNDINIFSQYKSEEIFRDKWVFIALEEIVPDSISHIDFIKSQAILSSGTAEIDTIIESKLGVKIDQNSSSSFSRVPEKIYRDRSIGVVPSIILKRISFRNTLFKIKVLDIDLDLPPFVLYQIWNCHSGGDIYLQNLRSVICNVCLPLSKVDIGLSAS